MDIIALILFGFLLLGFILAFRGRHKNGFERLMQANKDVAPLFKERSAKIKYDALFASFKNNPSALKVLENLQIDFLEKKISIDDYNEKLDEMTARNG